MGSKTTAINKAIKAISHFGASALANAAVPGAGLIGGPIMHLVSHLFNHFGTEVTSTLSHDLMERIGKNPHQLNHHLQQLYSRAVQDAITEGIVQSYEANEENPKLSKEQKNWLEKLSKEFDYAFDIASGHNLKAEDLILFIDEDRAEEGYIKLFEDRILPEYRPGYFFNHHNFPRDFEKHFHQGLMLIIRIFFIEGLKSPDHDKARIAYEQMMAEQTFKGLNDIKREIASLRSAGSLEKTKFARLPVQDFSNSVERIGSPEQLRSSFGEALRQYFRQFELKLDELLQLQKDTNTRVRRIDVKTERIEKGVRKGLILSYFLVIVAVAGIAWAFVHFKKKTITVSLSFIDENENTLSSGSFYISYGIKRESNTIDSKGISVFTEIPAGFEDKKVEILLADELSKKYRLDSASRKITLTSGTIIPIHLISRPVDTSSPARLPELVTPDNTASEVKQLNKEEVQQGGITRDVRASAGTAINQTASSLNGAIFSDAATGDKIQFGHLGGNLLSFSAEFEGIIFVSGKMRLNGSTLIATKDSEASGTLSLINDNKTIIGKLDIKGKDYDGKVEFTRK